MKNLACLLAVLAACSKAESPAATPSPAVAPPPTVVAPVAPAPSAPSVRFVAWQSAGGEHGDQVRFFTATATSVEEDRVVKLPSDPHIPTVNEVVWIGAEPIVRYDDHRVGRITEKGFEALPVVPAAKWSKKRPAPDAEEVTEAWSLTVTKTGAFVGHCRWGAKGYDDRDECNHWEYVRVYPGKLAKQAPDYDPPPEIPAIVPTKTTVKNLEMETGMVIACTRDGKTVEIPAADDPDRTYGMGGDLEWLSAEPAIFRVTAYSEGDPTTERMAVFENCAPTPFSNAVRGQHGVFALLGNGLATPTSPNDGVKTSIRREGREIGTVWESNVTFAP
jgi:hypothetical protein